MSTTSEQTDPIDDWSENTILKSVARGLWKGTRIKYDDGRELSISTFRDPQSYGESVEVLGHIDGEYVEIPLIPLVTQLKRHEAWITRYPNDDRVPKWPFHVIQHNSVDLDRAKELTSDHETLDFRNVDVVSLDAARELSHHVEFHGLIVESVSDPVERTIEEVHR